MKNIIRISAAALAAIALLLCFASCTPHPYEEKYVLYIGYSDKTDAELAAFKDQIDGIVLSHVSGYSFWIAEGGWTDGDGKFTDETAFVYSFNFADKSDIIALANEIIEKLPETSILFETQYTSAVHSSSEGFPKK